MCTGSSYADQVMCNLAWCWELHHAGGANREPLANHFIALMQAEKKRLERANKTMAERTIDAQRASATVPR